MTEKEIIEEIALMTRRQFDESSRQISAALDDSSIDTDYYGEVRSLIRQFMALAQQQAEERQHIYRVLTNPKPVI